MDFLTTIVAFLVALGCLIVVHEFGHYLVARRCGVKVLRFSIGFGKPLWSRAFGKDGTEWVIAAFPLGGYVKMLDEREGEVAPHERARAFNRQPLAKRFAIVAAGPVSNLLFAIALYSVLFMHGIPGMKPIVGPVSSGTAAAAAGFQPGDTLRKIGAERILTWQDARWVLLQHAVQRGRVSVEVHTAQGETRLRELDLSRLPASDLDGDFMTALGFTPFEPVLKPVIGAVIRGSPAERAGLKPGDEILAVGKQPVRSWMELVQAIRSHGGVPLQLRVRQSNGAQAVLSITPEVVSENGERIGQIGAGPFIDRAALAKLFVDVRYGPFESVQRAARKTWDMSMFSLRMLGKMAVGQVSLKNLSGPITIADYAGQSAHNGWVAYCLFLALISISLGVLNLLPIPLLDGGHLMYYTVEFFKGRPVSEKAVAIGQQVGMALLVILMVFALYNDINRLISG